MLLTDEQQMIQSLVREFSQDKLADHALVIDTEQKFPSEVISLLGELNLMGLTVPEEHSGAGVDTLSCCLVLEELARVSGTTALIVAAHNTLVLPLLQEHVTGVLRESLLAELASGQKLAAMGYMEIRRDHEKSSGPSIALNKGDHYLLTGGKTFVVNALNADVLVLAMRTDDVGGDSHFGLFLVERHQDGLMVEPLDEQLGMRGSASGTVLFENLRVEKSHCLVDPCQGKEAMDKILVFGQLGISAISLGLAQGAYERALRYAGERQQFGKPLTEFQAIQMQLADMATEIEAGRHFVHDAACSRDDGTVTARQIAMTKLFTTEMASRVCDRAIQIHGGYGYMTEYHVERYYRDAKLCEIGFVASEFQRITIARELLREVEGGLPLLH